MTGFEDIAEAELDGCKRTGDQASNNGSWSADDVDRPRWDQQTIFEKAYEYHREDGTYAYSVLKGRRADGQKTFLRGRRCQGTNDLQLAKQEDELYRLPGLDTYRKGTGAEPDLLYRLPELNEALAAEPLAQVFICEGEKDADTLWELGLTATTNSNGALHWKPEFNEQFAGCAVVVMVDNDDKGRSRAAKLYCALTPVAASVKIVELPGLKPNGDVSDWLEAGHDVQELLQVVAAVDAADPPGWIRRERDDAEFNRLAGLSRVEYDRARKDAALRLDISLSTLDAEVQALRPVNDLPALGGTALALPEIEPWNQPVDGADLLNDIVTALKRHVVFHSDHHALAVALWTMHTHLLDRAEHSPKLSIKSPAKRCGKTVLLDIVQPLVPRGLRVEHISPAALFRVIELYRPTLLIDEVDAFLKDNEEMRGLLNAGHKPGGQVVRCVGESQEPRAFAVFAAVALAGIGDLPSTIEDRSISIPLRRRRAEEKVERLRTYRDQLALLARRIARWAADNQDRLVAEPVLPEAMNDRSQDNWRLLIAIADAVGPEFGESARRAACALEFERDGDDDDVGLMALTDVQAVFSNPVNRAKATMASSSVVSALVAMEDRPWAQWRRGNPITQNSLTRLLKPYGIRSKQIKAHNSKGYERAPIEEAFKRYCSVKKEEEIEDEPM